MPSTNQQLARVFQQMADVLQITGGNRFRVNAFQKTARLINDLSTDVAGLSRDELLEIDGIGEGTADRIREYIDTGQIKDHQKLMGKVPPKLPALLDIQGLGPKTIALLWKEAGVESPESLHEKLKSDPDAISSIKGLGKKTVENIKKNLAFAEANADRVLIGNAMPLAIELRDAVRNIKGVKQCDYAGSLRRGKETIGDIDLLCAAPEQAAEDISNAFVDLDPVSEVLAKGKTKTSVRTQRGIQIDLRIVREDRYGAALLYFTGSKQHNVTLRERAIDKDKRLNEYGLWQGKNKPDNESDENLLAAKSEQAVYAKLGLPYIPPELREDRGEIKLAEWDKLPELVELGDIQAELHAHTTASDGRWSIQELAEAAAERGFHTVAVTDHSKGQVQANGLTNDRLEQHIKDIRKVAEKLKDTITVLAGSEVDILADGRMDYPDELLAELDIVVASPHAALSQDPDKATTRLLKAIENPYVTVLGHPTGRLVQRREGLSPDLDQLIDACKQRGIAMEINANTHRLDLRDTHARRAIDAGVKLSINTDAHGPADLDQLQYGILTARRAGATRNDIVNCLTKTRLTKWIKSTRA